MSLKLLSNFVEDLHDSKNYPGFCQIVKGTNGYSLNFSRVPMRTLPPCPRGCTLYSSLATALSSAIEQVSASPHPNGKRSNKILLPSHITYINEANSYV